MFANTRSPVAKDLKKKLNQDKSIKALEESLKRRNTPERSNWP